MDDGQEQSSEPIGEDGSICGNQLRVRSINISDEIGGNETGPLENTIELIP